MSIQKVIQPYQESKQSNVPIKNVLLLRVKLKMKLCLSDMMIQTSNIFTCVLTAILHGKQVNNNNKKIEVHNLNIFFYILP